MEAIAKSLPRSTDRLIEALSTLAALLDRTISEVKTLDSDFQNRLLQAVHDTESSLQQQAAEHLQRALQDADLKIRMQIREEMQGDIEREMKAAVGDLQEELTREREKLTAAIERAASVTSEWERERASLQQECERMAQELQQARALPPPVTQAPVPAALADCSAEMERVETILRQVTELIDNPATDLSTVIRKNVERAELEAYLKGMRFALR